MKNKSFVFAAALAGLFFASCNEKEPILKENIVSINETVNAGSLFSYRLPGGLFGEFVEVSKQAGHFETSEINRPKSAFGMEYLYRAPENFTGKEYAEVTLITSPCDGPREKTVYKFSLNVVSAK